MQDDPNEILSFEEAAAECGLTVEQLLTELVLAGDLIPDGDEDYKATDIMLSGETGIVPINIEKFINVSAVIAENGKDEQNGHHEPGR